MTTTTFSKQAKSFFHPNDFSCTPSHFATTTARYYSEISALSIDLLQALAFSLGLPEDHFIKKMRRHTSILTLNRFTCDGSLSNDVKIAEHTDVSMLTLVAQSCCPSIRLEIQNTDGFWIPCEYIKDTLIVNVGDCLADWTHGVLQSTKHRVRSLCTELAESNICSRLSLAYFVSPDYNALMGIKEDSQIIYHIWRKERIAKAMKVMKSLT